MKKLLFTFFALACFLPLHQAEAVFVSGFSYCRLWTINDGYTVGMATTTTVGMQFPATTTLPDFASTLAGGKIQVHGTYNGTTTPYDFVVVPDATDCPTGGTVGDFYVESWASTTGQIAFWWQQFDTSSTTEKYAAVYYGNASASNQQDEEGTWDSLGVVLHFDMNEDPTDGTGACSTAEVCDSTSNNNDGEENGTMTTADQVAGLVGGAIDFDGSNDFIDIPDSINGNAPWTFMLWVQMPSTLTGDPSRRFAVGSDYRNNNRSYLGSEFSDFYARIGDSDNFATGTLAVNQWYMMTLQRRATGLGVAWLNKAFGGSSTNSYGTGNELNIGSYREGLKSHWDGLIDDVIVSALAWDLADIQTRYNCFSSSAICYTIGDEETAGGGAAPAVPSGSHWRIF